MDNKSKFVILAGIAAIFLISKQKQKNIGIGNIPDGEHYTHKKTDGYEYISFGNPDGILSYILPPLEIIMLHKTITKSTKIKHDVDIETLSKLYEAMNNPVLVFQKRDNTAGILTELLDKNGKKIFVAIEFNTAVFRGYYKQFVNRITSVHGRENQYIIFPLIENESLLYAAPNAIDMIKEMPENDDITKEIKQQAVKYLLCFENKLPIIDF